jgi:26S proteasome regulatory subunit N2
MDCHPYCTPPILTSDFILRESLYESDDFPKEARHSAALLASKVYYFLGEYDEALSFALGAGSAFQAEARAHGSGEYVETVICECQAVLFHL